MLCRLCSTRLQIWIGMVFVSLIPSASAATAFRWGLRRKKTIPPAFDASGDAGLEPTKSGGFLRGGAAPRLR